MCQICEEHFGQMQSCPKCGILICFDEEPGVIDLVDRAYITKSKKVYCRTCGVKHDTDEKMTLEQAIQECQRCLDRAAELDSIIEREGGIESC